MPAPLPERPNLDQLRRQAKELRDAARDNDPLALDRIRRHLPQRDGAAVRLSAAQLVIAREHGFASWAALKAEVETTAMNLTQRVNAFVEASVGGRFGDPQTGRRLQQAARLLAATPGIAGYDFRTAVVLGEATRVQGFLARDRSLAVRPDDRSGWPPLLGVCGSHWHHLDPVRAAGLVEVARLLLEAGADPNTTVGAPGGCGYCSALYLAAGLANNPAITALLLERGADPDAPAALYHTAFNEDHACLRLLLDHGAAAEGGDTLAAAISVADTEAVRLLLEAGVDPGRPLPPGALGETCTAPVGPIYAAIEFGCAAELVELLLDRGADPDQPGPDGRSPYRLAVRAGHTHIAHLLLHHGVAGDTTIVDHLLGTCMRGDRNEAEQLMGAHPGLVERLADQDRAVIVEAAAHAPTAAVRLLLEVGVDVNTHRPGDGNTPLHEAAYAGRADLVRVLIDYGADVNARDTLFGSTPLAFATVGSGQPPRSGADADWVTTVQVLLAAGAGLEGAWIPAKPPSPEVALLLPAVYLDTEDPLAVAVVAAIRAGAIEELWRLLEEHPQLATVRLGTPGPEGMSRTLLHVATDWPGHYVNGPAVVAALVEAGADVNGRFAGPHTETALHWAASSDDVPVLDALLDAGADIEANGSVIGGGTPISDACAFAQWNAARRLVERGARTRLWEAAALGLMDRIRAYATASPPPSSDDITHALWSACHGGQHEAARFFLEYGGDRNWIGYDDLTPLDAARRVGAEDLADWLHTNGARSTAELRSR